MRATQSKIGFYGEWLATGERPREKPKISGAKRLNGRAKRR